MTEIVGHDFEQSTEAVFCSSKGSYSLQAATIFLLQCSSDVGTWLYAQKSVTSKSTGLGDAVLISLSAGAEENKQSFYVALLYQSAIKDINNAHPPNMEATSRIVYALFPF